jgi:hypothetical protein
MKKINYVLDCSQDAYFACWEVVSALTTAQPNRTKINFILATPSQIEIDFEYDTNCPEILTCVQQILAPYV